MGREATSFQTDARGITRVIYPEWIPKARELVYPAPAFSAAPTGAASHTLDYGDACNSIGFKFVGNSCGQCDASLLPCGTTSGAARCLLCAPVLVTPTAPTMLPWPTIVAVGASVVLLCSSALLGMYSLLRRQERLNQDKEMKEVAHAVDATTKLHHSAVLMPAVEFMRMKELRSFESLRDDVGKLRYFDTIEALQLELNGGKFLIFISHQWLSYEHPDPTTKQFKTMVAGVEHVAERMGWDLAQVLVWADFSCIPRAHTGHALPTASVHSHHCGVSTVCATGAYRKPTRQCSVRRSRRYRPTSPHHTPL